VSGQCYALSALSLWEEPCFEWVGSFHGSSAYMDIVEESKYIALGFLTPLLGVEESVYVALGYLTPSLGRGE
jgi:hypothetical protein